MVSPALKMTYAEQQARAAQKRAVLLGWLASGEVYTTTALAAALLGISEQAVAPLLKRLVAEKILRMEENVVPFSKIKIYGITAHGIAITESAHSRCREYFTGSLNPNYLAHHLEGQHIRILLERLGWTGYVPGKLLYVDNSQRLKTLPDALITRPDGHRVAIEIERNIKSQKRHAVMMGGHLQQIVAGHYQLVYFFTPHEAALHRVFQTVEYVIVNGDKVKITEAHRARFKIFDIKNPTL